MENQVLTIDQCKELVALGLDMSDASMSWIVSPCPHVVCGNIGDIPTYTLQDILEKFSDIKLEYDTSWESHIWKCSISHDIITFFGECPLEVTFNMLKWCIINKYI